MVRKRAVAGIATVVAGTAATAFGAITTPAQADVSGVTYSCTGDGLGQAIPVTVDITGTVPGTVRVGDTMNLENFQVTATVSSDVVTNVLATLGVERFSGAFTSLPISATAQDGTIHGEHNPGVDGRMPIGDVSVTSGQDLTLTSPPSAISVGPFPAEIPGTTRFSVSGDFALSLDATIGGVIRARHIDLNCAGATPQIAQVDVLEKETPPPGNGGTGTGGTGGGGQDNSGGGQTSGGSANTGTNTGNTNTNTGGSTGGTSTQGRGTLANTGAPYTIPMTAVGGALVLLGAGMLVAMRRWRPAVEDYEDAEI